MHTYTYTRTHIHVHTRTHTLLTIYVMNDINEHLMIIIMIQLIRIMITVMINGRRC